MPEPFKETLFSRPIVTRLAECISLSDPGFNQAEFLERVFDPSWADLELKDRMRHITLILKDMLPPDYRTALDILQRAASLHTEGGFVSLVYCDYVALYGLDDWEVSLPALQQFTCLCSAEFAVRPFIVKDQTRMLAQMRVWAGSENAQHRRLASEGSRPRLPWGISLPALKKDPLPLLPILEMLKADPDENVRRSVANNLNDITKDNPQVVLDLLKKWKEENNPNYKEIANRALRSLIKDGNPAALKLIGIRHAAEVQVANLKIEPAVIPFGGDITFSFDLVSTAENEQKLVVDYVVYLQRANNQQTPKVFKLTQKTLTPDETITITKKHSFKEVTTRRYYPGAHAVEIQVNGVACAKEAFEVSPL